MRILKGTIYFMAAEAIQRQYKYVSEEIAMTLLDDEFFHNPGHDMESVAWVIFYILAIVESNQDWVRKKIDDLLFTGLESSANDRFVFISGRSPGFSHYTKLFGDDRMDLFVVLNKLRTILSKCYRESEANYPNDPIDDSKFSGLYSEFDCIWSSSESYLADRDIRLNSRPEAKVARTGVKRPAETELTRSRQRLRMCVFFRLGIVELIFSRRT